MSEISRNLSAKPLIIPAGLEEKEKQKKKKRAKTYENNNNIFRLMDRKRDKSFKKLGKKHATKSWHLQLT